MNDVVAALESAVDPLLVTHRQADRDSLGAAIGLQALLGVGTVCVPDGVERRAQPLVAATDTEPVVDPSLDAFDTVVVLDAPSSDRIAPLEPAAPVLVDHHEPGDLLARAPAALVDTDAGATAELVARLASDAGWEMPPDAALALLVGVLDDTGFLRTASPAAVEVAAGLFGSLGDRARSLPDLLDSDPAAGERNARMLGVLRARGYRAGDYSFAVSQVGGHESAAASALRNAGVDLAAVCSEQSTGLRVTMRASDSFADRLSIGETLLPALAEEFGGDGGGHAAAGTGHLAEADLPAVERFLLTHLESALGVSFAEISI